MTDLASVSPMLAALGALVMVMAAAIWVLRR
jgi:hypothetical protein